MRRRAFLAAAVGTSLVAGCVGGDGAGGGSTPTGSGEPTDGGGESTGMAAYPDYDWDQLTRADAAETTEVAASGFAFQPLVARFPAGSVVTFTNDDSAPHTVTIPALDVDERLAGGETTTVSVESTGTYDYVCTLHRPGMLGRLIAE
jgi:plastocyanin